MKSQCSARLVYVAEFSVGRIQGVIQGLIGREGANEMNGRLKTQLQTHLRWGETQGNISSQSWNFVRGMALSCVLLLPSDVVCGQVTALLPLSQLSGP